MVGRLGLGIATALSLLSAGGLYAQGMGPAPGSQANISNGYPGPGAYASAAPGSGTQLVSQGLSPFGTNPQPAFGPPGTGPSSVAPAAYSMQDPNSDASQPGCPGSSAYSKMPGCGAEGSDDFVETPWEEILCRVVRNVDIRLDYINWGISRPRTVLIGDYPGPGLLQPTFGLISFDGFFFSNPNPPAVQKNPTDVFPILDNNFNQIGQARAYDTTGISLYENSGFQGTFSVPMTYGTIEASGFILGKANSAPNPGGLPGGIPGINQAFAAIPVDIGGKPSETVALFSQGFEQSFSSFVFGGETNVYLNAIVPKDYGLVFKPMVGFRYLGIDEHFNVTGINPGPSISTIESSTINNIYGPTVGCRLELLTQWFSIGVDPRVTFAVNQFAANVNASDPTVGDAHDHQIDARFAPVGAVDAFIKIPIHERFRLYAAYNLIGTTNISRPQEQIDYNVTTGGQNDTHLSLASAGIMIQGYSVGCEFNF
jgi:hypothetical protein